MPVASAIVERAWLTGVPDSRVAECHSLLRDAPRNGLEWARGELAMWLRRIDGSDIAAPDVAEPYALLFDGRYEAAAEQFHRLSTPYDA
ncbi:LuxR family transcriptional regulator, partial [Mycobacterium sp. ITM-2017-0098]